MRTYAYVDLTNQRFGRLRVLRRVPPPTGARGAYWRCACDCGTTCAVYGGVLRNATTTSCGCLRRERLRTHGQSKTPEYRIFLVDMGPRPSSLRGARRATHSIERIDNNGNYTPENCRWAAQREQARNQRSNRLLTIDGKQMCLTDAAKRLGLRVGTLWWRLEHGWSDARLSA